MVTRRHCGFLIDAKVICLSEDSKNSRNNTKSGLVMNGVESGQYPVIFN